ncbi:MAG: UDP-2,3-diacylglucosamine diphosphatase LpxI [Candidatus Sumerlaeales bacterium]|nr:UDP-2,3-diacylglucosamine diphosphatase LpxI [Candidatus Sumerlaeales bacterium]
MPKPKYEKIALIAGQGVFPISIVRGAHSENIRVVVLAIKGFCSDEIEQYADKIYWVELGQAQKGLDILQKENIKYIVMAGRVPHQTIFQYRHFDTLALKVLARTMTKRADGILNAVVKAMESYGIEVLDSSLFVRQLFQPAGLLTPKRPLTKAEEEDIRFGLPIARSVAGLDIGQTIVVKDKSVIAVEGLEGTDECIKRAGELAGPGCVVIKVSKPAQDKRFDIPIIGPTTIKSMKTAQASVLAFSANEALMFGKDEIVTNAESAGIAVCAVNNITAESQNNLY